MPFAVVPPDEAKFSVNRRNGSVTRIAIIHYSSTGKNYRVARAVEAGALKAGAQKRLRKVRELAPPEAIDRNPAWRAHPKATADVPEATLDDLEWADGYVFGTPTRFGGPAAQLKQFLDTAGGLWAKGTLADKPAAAFTSASNDHGGQESTLLALYNVMYHWGAIIVPAGYTDPRFATAGGNPYGVSFTDPRKGELSEGVLSAASALGERLTRFASALRALRGLE
jgi:NAD(P)H dehydrogenase (quinone)